MYICCVGDIHGKVHQMYSEVQAFATSLGVTVSYILQVGDFGIYSKNSTPDAATLRHSGVGDFPEMYDKQTVVPIPTVFIHGNHEDFDFLYQASVLGAELIPGLFYLKNGTKFNVGGVNPLYVGGVGGCYGPSSYLKPSTSWRQAKQRHYTREQIDTLIANDPLDILMTHEAPHGVRLTGHHKTYTTEALGLDDIVEALHPRIWVFGHHHCGYEETRKKTQIIGLASLGNNGSMIMIELLGDTLEIIGRNS